MYDTEIVTITFFHYRGARDRWFGFRQMGLAPRRLRDISGLTFGKMLGSGGGNGFSIWPDFSTYGFLGVWNNEAAARTFLTEHRFVAELRERSHQMGTLFMRTAKVHGQWDKRTPFVENEPYQPDAPVGVLTRATISRKHLRQFWRFVPPVSRSMSQHRDGLLFSKGIGEVPIIQQATFSLWSDSHAMRAYAYESHHHKQVVRKTRETGWYSEELFARFHPYAVQGALPGLKQSLDGLGLEEYSTKGMMNAE